MQIKNLIDEDFIQYKKPSMFIGFPKCSFKCGAELCQNSALALAPTVDISPSEICRRYINNPITEAFVFGGLDPFDTPQECYELVHVIRHENNIDDDIVIYTGYTEQEIQQFNNPFIQSILAQKNIIIKYGRYIPNHKPHYDEILGIQLASDNQYGVKYNET